MSEPEFPQIYLVTPRRFELSRFPEQLAGLLDAVPVACLRLATDSRDVDEVSRAADTLRAVAHERDVPLVIEDHFKLVEPLGLDGVHFSDGARQVREVRKALGQDPIVGAFCGASRHAGMTAGEIGADYISFGPVDAPAELGDGDLADRSLFEWWSQMIELPVVAEGGLTDALVRDLAPVVDFFAFSDEVWRANDARAEATSLHAAMRHGT